MGEISPLLIIFIIWLCIGLPLSKINQAKKKNGTNRLSSSGRPAEPAVPVQDTSREGPAPEAPPARESRLAPTVSVTVGDDSVYAGSMNAVTGEGYDPCHDAELEGLNSAESIVPVHPAGDVPSLPFGWTGSDMVRGIVVSEILNRKKGCRR